jgi:homocysteine S-methyltransferase
MTNAAAKPPLLDRLKKSVLVADGAMGTMVSQLSPRAVECIEALTIDNPALISDIHRQYVRAGAAIIETNSFAANRIALARFHLESRAAEICGASVRLAAAEAGPDVYVAGSIGPVRASAGGDATQISDADCRRALDEQMQALLDAGVDLLIFETFSDATELLNAVRCAKACTKMPVIASMTASRFGTTAGGESLALSAKKLVDAGADIIGLNCGYGIRAIEGAMEHIAHLGVPVSVMPNAGFPEQVGGRLRFGASEEYLANEAVTLAQMGARIIGGCCGTTPAHIEAIADKLREKRIVVKQRARPDIAPARADEAFKPGRLLTSFASVRLPIICEIDPPSTLAIQKSSDAIIAAVDAGAQAISMADNPLATIKIENLAFAAFLRQRTDIPIVLHCTGRDRNLLGLQSFMLGAQVLGIEALLCVTGDPSNQHGGPSNVFDANSLGLIKMAAHLNRGRNLLGKDIGMQTDFSIGAAVNPNLDDFSPQLRHLKNKVAAGARFAMTQPMYEPGAITAFLAAARSLDIKIFVGIMPALSSRTAEYLHHEVPGIVIPQKLRDLLKKKENAEYQKQAGLEYIRQLISDIASKVDGLYLIAPHTQPLVLSELVRCGKKG